MKTTLQSGSRVTKSVQVLVTQLKTGTIVSSFGKGKSQRVYVKWDGEAGNPESNIPAKLKAISAKDTYFALETLATGECWDIVASGHNNATDTWREQRRGDDMDEEFYAFAIESMRGLLCEASDEAGAWFRANGINF